MGSRLVNEKNTSVEKNLEECEILPSSSKRLKCKKNKSSFKSPALTKQLNIHPETKNLKKNRDTEDNTDEEETDMVRRSKRRKTSDSCIDQEEISSTNINHNLQNNIKTTEFENVNQNCSVNVIPKNVLKILDHELFPEEDDEEPSLNENYAGAALDQRQIDAIIERKNEPVLKEVGNTILIEMEVDYNINSQTTDLKIHDESTAGSKCNGKETHTDEENTEGNNMRPILNQQLSPTSEDNEKYSRNINTKSITNIIGNDDSSLDLLTLDIKKADDIIHSLAKPANMENNSSQKRHISNSKFYSTENNSVNECFYAEKSNNTLSEHSFDSTPSTSSKNSLIIIDDQQPKFLEYMSNMKNKESEKQNEVPNDSDNLAIKKEKNEEKCNSLSNSDSSKFYDNTILSENLTGNNKTLHIHDSFEQSNNQILRENKTNLFPLTNGNSHENNDFNNSQNSNIQIHNSCTEINHSENSTDETKHSEENLGTKRVKLTLLYMSALDYEKENKEHDYEIVEKINETKNETLHSDVSEECTCNDTSDTQRNLKIPKQNFNDLSKGKDVHDTKTALDIHIDQYVNKNISNEKDVMGDTQPNSEKEKKDTFNQKIANQAENVITDERPSLNDLSPMKCDLLCCKEMDKKHNFQEHFIALQFQENIPSPAASSSTLDINNNEVNFKAVDAETEETKKWYKNKVLQEADTTFIVTAAECFKSEKSEGIANNKKDKDAKNFNEDKIPHEDADASFDMDDDFDLTASQINMIEINENSQYKKIDESKSCMKVGNCSDTHFGQDSITVEIMDNLCYIRESVDSIKELLKTFMTKTDGKE